MKEIIKGRANRLINEKSPYLLQHAHNPVDWYPWGEEAFERAKTEDKPIFLSIGYSTCHWCHVMEKECFEDEEVASLLNDTFICIKVDREERPDIDNVYMTVCQMMTGSGGWPLTIMMTFDKKPFYAATYIPKESKYERPGLIEIIPAIKQMWTNNKEQILKSADNIILAIEKSNKYEERFDLNADILEKAFNQFDMSFDDENGGFGRAPKFPSPHNLMFLLMYHNRTKNQRAIEMVTKTLDAMYIGGIFDQIGFGFHRYSTDEKWLLPHFEKMLYDQAMLSMAYTEAYLATGSNDYKTASERIIEYILRDMTSLEGGFYSAEDADSEGIEGKFYVWSLDEIKQVLSKDETELAIRIFNIKKEGNYIEEATGIRTGKNILYLKNPLKQIEMTMNISNIDKIIKKLFLEREKRVKPHKDDKILTDWNSLMIAALCRASAAFDNREYLLHAKKAIDFILNSMDNNGRVMHRYRNGEWKFIGNLDDYAFLVWALIEYYEASFDVYYLEKAFKLNDKMIDLFLDKENGGFFFTSDDSEKILTRSKEIFDGAIPSGNSIAVFNLIRLSKISANYEYEKIVDKTISAFSRDLLQSPFAYSMMLCALEFYFGEDIEIVIAGDLESTDTKEMLKNIRKRYIPRKIILLNTEDEDAKKLYSIAEYVKNQGKIKEKSTAYICKNLACKEPVNDIEEMIRLIYE